MNAMCEAASKAATPACVDVLLVSFNSAHLLERLRQTLQCVNLPLRLLAVDNASSDHSGDLLRSLLGCDVFIQNEVNVGFGRANNQLLEYVRSPYVLLLNTDAFVAPDTIEKSLQYMDAHPRCGIVGVRLTGSDGTLQPSRRSFPTPLKVFLRRTGLERLLPLPGVRHDIEEDHGTVAECDWVPGCYYLVRRAVIDDIGLFDPRFFLYFEEVDHCRRARAAGWTVTYLPSTSVVHLGGESAKSVARLSRDRQWSVLQVESELLYMRKHYGRTGVVLHLALGALAALLLAGKDVAKRRGAHCAMSHLHEAHVGWRLAARTGFGARPTR